MAKRLILGWRTWTDKTTGEPRAAVDLAQHRDDDGRGAGLEISNIMCKVAVIEPLRGYASNTFPIETEVELGIKSMGKQNYPTLESIRVVAKSKAGA